MMSDDTITEKHAVLDEMSGDWGRFQLVELIGKGGMGDVYKAYDPHLERHIALKILRHEDSETLTRFLREARSQALVEHRHVCKVYESGEWQGHPYIAMQLIEGKTLKHAGKSLSLEQKLRIIKEIALGLQSAHSRGLVHRDVKPDNIMIGQTEEGNLAPYIMDFGIAREQSAPGLTTTGMIMGTPFYLAPELASGKVGDLDRRCDIYSLGVTMYELLTGAVPFRGTNPVEVLIKVIEKEPQPLRKLNPSIPLDVETIVMKCIEKDPDRRYGSARELAEDIQHYLDGDPISARPVTMPYRIKRKLVKHKRTTIMGVAASVVILVLIGLWLQTRWTASQRAEIAQQLGQEVEKIESMIHLAHLLPPHNISREKNLIRKRIEGIREKMEQVGSLGLGPGHYAMGRGYIALQEYEKARQHLENSLNEGFRTPDVSFELGRVMGELYLQQSEKANRLLNKELREDRLEEIEKKLRQPAVRYLLQGAGVENKSQGYISAMIAFYEKKHQKALTILQEAVKNSDEQEPWMYDAKILEGNIYSELGLKESYFDDKIENYTRAEKAYREVAKIGESDIRGYMGLSRVLERRLVARLHFKGGDLEPMAQQAVEQCRKARRIDPEIAEPYVKEASVYCRLGRHQVFNGKDPINSFKLSKNAADQAIKLQRDNFEAYTIAGITARYQAEYLKEQGQDPGPTYQLAALKFEKAIGINPTFVEAYNGLGNVHIRIAQLKLGRGEEPDSSLDEAISTFKDALAINPGLANLRNGLAGALWVKGGLLAGRGLDARNAYQEAAQSMEKAIEINPNVMHYYSNLGFIYKDLGGYQLHSGFHPGQALDKADQYFERAMEINPKASEHYLGLVDSSTLRSRYNHWLGKSGGTYLKRARKYFDKGIAVNVKFPKLHVCMAENYILQARCLTHSNRTALSMLKQAEGLLQSARKINPKNIDIYIQEGEMMLSRAACVLNSKQNPSAFFKKAEQALDRAEELNPKYIKFHLAGARLHRVMAEWKISLSREATAKIHLTQALDHLKKALEINANNAEAHALKGVLLNMRAALTRYKIKRDADEKAARTALLKGIQLNKNLEKMYSKYLKR